MTERHDEPEFSGSRDDDERFYHEALDHLRPSASRAERLLSDLIEDRTLPQAIRDRITEAFELTEDELLALARRGLESAELMMRCVLDQPHFKDPELAQAHADIRRILVKNRFRIMTPRTGVRPARVAIPGSPTWKAHAKERVKGSPRAPGSPPVTPHPQGIATAPIVPASPPPAAPSSTASPRKKGT
jgi:hypothetical protein